MLFELFGDVLSEIIVAYADGGWAASMLAAPAPDHRAVGIRGLLRECETPA